MFKINRSAIIWSSVIIIITSLLLVIVLQSGFSEPKKIILTQLLTIFVLGAGLNTVWELYSKNRLKKDIIDAKTLSEEIAKSGLTGIKPPVVFQETHNWKELFSDVKDLDLFISYGSTWRGSNRTRLNNLSKMKDSKVNIVLPDFKNKRVVDQLSSWFNTDSNRIEVKIKEAANDFSRIFEDCDCDFQLYLTETTPVYSFYRFDKKIILALYKHDPERRGVPSFLINNTGYLYDFVTNDFEALINNSRIYTYDDQASE